jgi:hypothetical protein
MVVGKEPRLQKDEGCALAEYVHADMIMSPAGTAVIHIPPGRIFASRAMVSGVGVSAAAGSSPATLWRWEMVDSGYPFIDKSVALQETWVTMKKKLMCGCGQVFALFFLARCPCALVSEGFQNAWDTGDTSAGFSFCFVFCVFKLTLGCRQEFALFFLASCPSALVSEAFQRALDTGDTDAGFFCGLCFHSPAINTCQTKKDSLING